MQIKNVAVIGTGIMGAPIAAHLLDAGFDVTVHNRTREKAEVLLARGAHWADTPAEAAAQADVVLTMVGYPTDVEDVYLSTEGLIRSAKKGTWLIDLTTSSPQLARDIHDAAEVEDKHAFDCPVTGGEQGAIDGTLTLIIGATEDQVAPVLPVLEAFSARRFYFDQPGGGQAAKLCNQVSLASCMVGYADARALARPCGLETARGHGRLRRVQDPRAQVPRRRLQAGLSRRAPAQGHRPCAPALRGARDHAPGRRDGLHAL